MRQTITNFNQGIKASSGYTPYKDISAAEMLNFDVDDYGRLVRRKGSVHINSAALPAAPKFAERVYYRKTGLGNEEHLIVACNNAQGLWYLSGGNFTELKNSSDAVPSSIDLSGSPSARFGSAVFTGRMFMGNGSSNGQLWVKISTDPPVAYYHGFHHGTAGRPAAPTAVAVTDGPPPASPLAGWYGYAVTFYRDGEVIESRPSQRDAVDVAGADNAVDLTFEVSDDKQVTQRKIYRTLTQANEADAGTATLYLITTIGDNTTTTYHDDSDIGQSSTPITSADHDFPPQYHYIDEHAARLWIADDDDSFVYFTKFDSTGAPVVDVFPFTNATVPHRFNVGQDGGDVISAIMPSPTGQQLLIFKRNSIYVVYGNSPSTLDAHTRLPAAGCAAPFSIALVGTAIYFLANDNKIWVSAGQVPVPISLPVQPILDQIPFDRFNQVMGINFDGKYMMTFPSGDNSNDRVLVFDPDRKNFTMHDLEINWFSYWRGEEPTAADKNRLVGALSGSGYVDYLFKDSAGNDLTDDNGSDITASWLSNWFEFPEPSVLTGVYVLDDSGGAYTVRIDSKSESGIVTEQTFNAFAPVASNNYRQGCFARGHQFRVYLSTTDDVTISRMEIEYETR